MVLAVVRFSVYPVDDPCHFFGLMGRCLGAVWIFLTITRGAFLFIAILVVRRPHSFIPPSVLRLAVNRESWKPDKLPNAGAASLRQDVDDAGAPAGRGGSRATSLNYTRHREAESDP